MKSLTLFLMALVISAPVGYANPQTADTAPNILVTFVSTPDTTYIKNDQCTIDVAPSNQSIIVTTIDGRTSISTEYDLPRGVIQEDGSCRFRLMIQPDLGDTYLFQIADDETSLPIDGTQLRMGQRIFLSYPLEADQANPDARDSFIERTQLEEEAVYLDVSLVIFVPESLLAEEVEDCELAWGRRGPKVSLWSEYYGDYYPILLRNGTHTTSSEKGPGCEFVREVVLVKSDYHVLWVGGSKYLELEGSEINDGDEIRITLDSYP